MPGLTNPGADHPRSDHTGADQPRRRAPGGLTRPDHPPACDPALTPISSTPGLGVPGEIPISAPVGLDPALGTYPILGDPSLAAAAPVSTAAADCSATCPARPTSWAPARRSTCSRAW